MTQDSRIGIAAFLSRIISYIMTDIEKRQTFRLQHTETRDSPQTSDTLSVGLKKTPRAINDF